MGPELTSLTKFKKYVLWDFMRIEKAKEITGSLSKPSKMPGHAYGLPAQECKTGGKLQKVKGSTCYGCYALKGCYVFKVVQAAQYKRLKAIRHPLWVKAMTMQINSKKTSRPASLFIVPYTLTNRGLDKARLLP